MGRGNSRSGGRGGNNTNGGGSNDNNSRNGGGGGGNNDAPRVCGYCNKPGHSAHTCFKNPNNGISNGQTGQGGQGDRGGKRSQQKGPCSYCNKSSHDASGCFSNPDSSAFKGKSGKGGKQGQQQQQQQQTEPDAAPQVRNGTKLNRPCKDCQQWHIDCGNRHQSNRKNKNNARMEASGYNSDDEQEEPRWPQAMPPLQRTGLKWPCPWTGQQIDCDSEGDVIMLELANSQRQPMPYKDFGYLQWHGQNNHQQCWDLPHQPPHVLNKLPRDAWPKNPGGASNFDGVFDIL